MHINRCVYTGGHIQASIYRWVYTRAGGYYTGGHDPSSSFCHLLSVSLCQTMHCVDRPQAFRPQVCASEIRGSSTVEFTTLSSSADWISAN